MADTHPGPRTATQPSLSPSLSDTPPAPGAPLHHSDPTSSSTDPGNDAQALDLEAVLHLEESLLAVGAQAGVAHGRARGTAEGFDAGYSVGHEIGTEMGMYKGQCEVWAEHMTMSESTRGAISRLIACVDSLSTLDPASDAYHDAVVKARTTYKMITINLKIQPDAVGTATGGDTSASNGLDF
eukprot:m.25698 g.25698  ORF g.25698 m.25698 type:complete len:183 (+) comp4262_c0_seq2:47-595(+)